MANGKMMDLNRSEATPAKSRVAAREDVRQISADEHLYFEGDARTHVFVVEKGWVKLYRTLIDGQRQVVGFANPGSVLGLESDGDYSNGCQAMTPVTVKAIRSSQISELCRSDGAFAQQLLGQVGRQLGAAQSQLATVGTQSAEQRVASFLISISDLCDAAHGEEFDLPMRRGDMAEFLGLRLETISRQMSEFQRRGRIRMTSLYHCRISRRDVLEELAQGGEADDMMSLPRASGHRALKRPSAQSAALCA